VLLPSLTKSTFMKQTLTLLLAAFAFHYGFAQTEPQMLYPFDQNTPYLTSIPLALDYDWNGEVDYLGQNGVVYLNPGTPNAATMQTNVTFPVPQYAHDFSGDGRPDILIASSFYPQDISSDTEVSFSLALGGGGQSATIIPLGISSTSILADDVDNDGDYDLLCNHDILYNDGSASFTTVNFTGTTRIWSAADINGDGLRDLITREPSSSIYNVPYFRLNLGSSFSDDISFNLGLLESNPGNYGFIDYDGDQDDDLVMENGTYVVLFENDGSGSFSNETFVYDFGFTQLVENSRFFVFDFDQDGDQDVSIDANAFLINTNDGVINVVSSAFSITEAYKNFYESPGAIFSGYVLNSYLGYAVNYLFDGDMSMTYDEGFVHSDLTDRATCFLQDMDADGNDDVILGSAAGSWSFLKRVGNGELQYHSGMIDIYAYDYGAGGIVGVTDFDHDGTPNFIAITNSTSSRIMEFPASGPFATEVVEGYMSLMNVPGSLSATRMNTLDFNNDGNEDLLYQNQGDDGSWIYSDGNYIPLNYYTDINYQLGGYMDYSMGYAYVDFNNDGLLDVFNPVASSVYIQEAGFTFNEVICFDPATDPNNSEQLYLMYDDPEVADLNGDGYDDVLGHGFLFMNDGGSLYLSQALVENPLDYFSSLWDFDNDGDLDILLSSVTISLLENLGNGVFANAVIAEPNAYFRDASVVDWDTDGDMELLFIGQFNGQPGLFVWGAVGTTTTPASLSGKLFVDDNANNIYDIGEFTLSNESVHLEINNSVFYHYTNESGTYSYSLLGAGNYGVGVNANAGNGLVCNTPSSSVNLVASQNAVVDFAYQPTIIGTSLIVDHNPGLARCNRLSTMYISVYNDGTTTPDGLLTLNLSPDITVFSSSLAPLSQSASQIIWELADIPRYDWTVISISVQYPNANFVGDVFTSSVVLDITDDLSAPNYTSLISQTLNCAYDPNDIQELTGYTEQLYVNGLEPLDYVVRFQNTGTAPATVVAIEDVLSPNLDWSTLQPTMWSHDLSEVTIDETGQARFVFNNINLPDSSVDMAGSQGFIRFSILPIEGLAHGTTIENTASIFFDQNEAVVTNTVINHVFDCATFTPQFDLFSTQICFQQVTTASYEYEWADVVSWSDNFPNSPIINADQIVYSDVNNGFTLTLHAENALCGAVEQTTNVQMVDLNLPAITASDEIICISETATLVSNFDNGNTWYLNDNFLSTDSQIVVDQPGDYSLVVTQGECVSDLVAMFIEVNSGPSQPFISLNENVLSTDFISEVSYQWYLNGTEISGATNSSYTATQNGAYYVVATNDLGCSSTSAVTDFVVGVINENKNITSIYPNPAHDAVRITFSDATRKNVRISSPDGKLIYESSVTGLSTEVQLAGLAAGQYVISIVSDAGTENEVLIVE
jgi:Secretion system C-terminal sorting domain